MIITWTPSASLKSVHADLPIDDDDIHTSIRTSAQPTVQTIIRAENVNRDVLLYVIPILAIIIKFTGNITPHSRHSYRKNLNPQACSYDWSLLTTQAHTDPEILTFHFMACLGLEFEGNMGSADGLCMTSIVLHRRSLRNSVFDMWILWKKVLVSCTSFRVSTNVGRGREGIVGGIPYPIFVHLIFDIRYSISPDMGFGKDIAFHWVPFYFNNIKEWTSGRTKKWYLMKIKWGWGSL